MPPHPLPPGAAEIAAARAEDRGLLLAVALFSAFVNLLMLTGPMFMLQVYDRVLGARSTETLTALFLLVVLLFAAMGLLDFARGRIMLRVGARFRTRLEERVFAAMFRRGTTRPDDPRALAALRDLDAVERLLGAPVFLALFDLPWSPIFFAAIFFFSPLLGFLALAGGAVLIAVTVLNQILTAPRIGTAAQRQIGADRLSDQLRDEAGTLAALGMRDTAFHRWQEARRQAGETALKAADLNGGFSTFTRTFRLFLQSAMLALGAWVVLRGEMTAGAMIAGSILMGRALAPIEQTVAGWPLVARGREGRRRLAALLAATPSAPPKTALPRPRAVLEVQDLAVVPPDSRTATLRALSFRLEPGQALGVIGPSGAGKSTLARAICNIWPPASGTIRLGGATLDQYDPDVLGQMTGYLPQRVPLFDGTVAQNIARLAAAPDAKAVVAAAKRADAHRMILDLPEGYDTRVSRAGERLSGGQIQRIGLARALYGAPVLLILDEPNSNLDNEGGQALNRAIRDTKAAGGAVLVMAHRPAAIAECDLLLLLENGLPRAFGPRDEVLRGTVRNAPDIARRAGAGGVA